MKKVLIVDDSIFMYEEINMMLRETEYQVVGYAKSGEESLEEYEKVQPDIVTMDIILPGIDGMEATRQILNRWPNACVLMISSLAYGETQIEAKSSGAKGFIFKPLEQSSFIDMLNQISDETQNTPTESEPSK